MKLKKLVKNIYSESYVIVSDDMCKKLFRGFAHELLRTINNGEIDNRKLFRIKEEYDNDTNAVVINIYVK